MKLPGIITRPVFFVPAAVCVALIAFLLLGDSGKDVNHPMKLDYPTLRMIGVMSGDSGSFSPHTLSRYNGRFVTITGALLPFSDVPPDGKLLAFWLINPNLMSGGCVFCNPGSVFEMVYVVTDKGREGIKVDKEKLYSGIVQVTVQGKLFLGAEESPDGLRYLYKIVR
jgi:hypothetical protein